jgi:hypothetical protein
MDPCPTAHDLTLFFATTLFALVSAKRCPRILQGGTLSKQVIIPENTSTS